MNSEVETIYEDRRGRMKLKIVRKSGKYGTMFSALVYRPFTTEEYLVRPTNAFPTKSDFRSHLLPS